MQRGRAHDYRVHRGAQQSHDETVSLIRPADFAATGFSWDSVTDHAVEGANEISNYVGVAVAGPGDVKISSVKHAKIFGQHRRTGWLLAVKQGPDRFHGDIT